MQTAVTEDRALQGCNLSAGDGPKLAGVALGLPLPVTQTVSLKLEMFMAMLDWSQCSAVESVPGRLGGAWVLRGTRLPVATIFENLEDLSIEGVMEQFDVTREQIKSLLEFAARSADTTPPIQPFPSAADARSL